MSVLPASQSSRIATGTPKRCAAADLPIRETACTKSRLRVIDVTNATPAGLLHRRAECNGRVAGDLDKLRQSIGRMRQLGLMPLCNPNFAQEGARQMHPSL